MESSQNSQSTDEHQFEYSSAVKPFLTSTLLGKKDLLRTRLQILLDEHKDNQEWCRKARFLYEKGDTDDELNSKIDNLDMYLSGRLEASSVHETGTWAQKCRFFFKGLGATDLFGKESKPARRDQFEKVHESKCCCGLIKFNVHEEVSPLNENAQYLTQDDIEISMVQYLAKLRGNRARLCSYNCSNNFQAIFISFVLTIILLPTIVNAMQTQNQLAKFGGNDIYLQHTLAKAFIIVSAIISFYACFCVKLSILAFNDNNWLCLSYMTLMVCLSAAYLIQFKSETEILAGKGAFYADLYENAQKVGEKYRTSAQNYTIRHFEKEFSCCSAKGYHDYDIEEIPMKCFKNKFSYGKYRTDVELDREITQINLKKWCKEKGCIELISQSNIDMPSILHVAWDSAIFFFLTLAAPFWLLIKRDTLVEYNLIWLHLKNHNDDVKARLNDVIYISSMDKLLSGNFLRKDAKDKLQMYMPDLEKKLHAFQIILDRN